MQHISIKLSWNSDLDVLGVVALGAVVLVDCQLEDHDLTDLQTDDWIGDLGGVGGQRGDRHLQQSTTTTGHRRGLSLSRVCHREKLRNITMIVGVKCLLSNFFSAKSGQIFLVALAKG